MGNKEPDPWRFLRRAPAILPYYGGKQRAAKWVVSRFSKGQETWIEPFGGGLSTSMAAIVYHRPKRVVVAEKRAKLREFYKLVRDQPLSAKQRWLTYQHRGVAWLSSHRLSDIDDPVLWALRLFCTFSRVDHGPALAENHAAARSHVTKFAWVSTILRRADFVIYDDWREALQEAGVVYADPPYAKTDSYDVANRWTSDQDEALVEELSKRKYPVLVSTYSADLYSGWRHLIPPARVNGARAMRTKRGETMKESGEIWAWRSGD